MGLLSWWKESRRWTRARDAAWRPALVRGEDGLGGFQRECVAALGTKYPNLVIAKVGEKEPHFEGSIGPVKFVIYDDTTGIKSPNVSRMFEYYDFESPEKLIEAFLQKLQQTIET